MLITCIIPGFIFLLIGIMAAIFPKSTVRSCNFLSAKDKTKIDDKLAAKFIKYVSFIVGSILISGNTFISLYTKDPDLWIALYMFPVIFGGICILAVKLRISIMDRDK